MKIQIDFDQKIIKLEDSSNLGDFIEKMKTLFPNKEWKEYKLETNVTIESGTTFIPYYPQPWYSYPTYVYTDGAGGNIMYNSNTDKPSGTLSISI